MLWVVEVQTTSPDDELGGDLLSTLQSCLRGLLHDQPSGNCDTNGWAISITVVADDMRRAWHVAMNRLFEAATESGLPLWPLVAVSVTHVEYAAAMN